MLHGFSLKPHRNKGLHGFGAEDAPPGEVPSRPARPSQAWMLIFADLVSLMLTFFVMLFAMSSVQVDQWDKMVDAMSRSMTPPKDEAVPVSTAKYNIGSVFRRRAMNVDYLYGVLEDILAKEAKLSNVTLQTLDDRVVVSLPAVRMFEPGRAVLSADAKGSLVLLGGFLRNITNQIAVSGHAGAVPTGGSYSSNWELSIARAAAVANSLKEAGYPDDIISFGMGDSRSADLENLPEDQRVQMAERVDVLILSAGKGM